MMQSGKSELITQKLGVKNVSMQGGEVTEKKPTFKFFGTFV